MAEADETGQKDTIRLGRAACSRMRWMLTWHGEGLFFEVAINSYCLVSLQMIRGG